MATKKSEKRWFEKIPGFAQSGWKGVTFFGGALVVILGILTNLNNIIDKFQELKSKTVKTGSYTEYIIDSSFKMEEPFSDDPSQTKWDHLRTKVEYRFGMSIKAGEKIALRTFGGECRPGEVDAASRLLKDFGSYKAEELKKALNDVTLGGSPAMDFGLLGAIEDFQKLKNNKNEVYIFTANGGSCEDDYIHDILEEMETLGIKPKIKIIGLDAGLADSLVVLAKALDGSFINAKNAIEFQSVLEFEGLDVQDKLAEAKKYWDEDIYFNERLAESFLLDLSDDENEEVRKEARRYLGHIYSNQNGELKNYQKAYTYYGLAADAGDAESMCRLAQMYEEGLGLDQPDERKANGWKTKAKENGMNC